MVYVYVADIKELPDPKNHPKLIEQLPDVRRQKIQELQSEKSRCQSFGASLLLMKVLSRFSVDGDAIFFGEHGKPLLQNLSFNLSHSDDLVVCAIGEKPVGCDVQRTEHKKFDKEFLRCWTLEESYAKMTGEGMALIRGKVELLFGDSVKVLREGEIQPCYFREYEVDGYWISVCTEEKEFSDLIWEKISI